MEGKADFVENVGGFVRVLLRLGFELGSFAGNFLGPVGGASFGESGNVRHIVGDFCDFVIWLPIWYDLFIPD